MGLPICEAFVAYDEQDFAKAVDILYPKRYNIWKIGGSNAQVGNSCSDITKTHLFKYIENFASKKLKIFR